MLLFFLKQKGNSIKEILSVLHNEERKMQTRQKCELKIPNYRIIIQCILALRKFYRY